MKFLILAYNPNYVNVKDLAELMNEMREDYVGFKIYVIAHVQNHREPIYTVQFANTTK